MYTRSSPLVNDIGWGAYDDELLYESTFDTDWIEKSSSPHHSSRKGKKVTSIIYHYTAGPTLNGTVRWFKNPDAKVSAHYVVGKTGRVVQMVNLNRAAWHAGRSVLHGRKGVNSSSVGIEIVNWGILKKTESGFITRTGKKYTGNAPVVREGKYWEPYTPAQYKALIRLTQMLISRFPDIHTITGHEDIAPGRKTDPGRGFDWSKIKQALPDFTGHIGQLLPQTKVDSAKVTRLPVSISPTTDEITHKTKKNNEFAKRLGWIDHFDRIVKLLGYFSYTPGPAEFIKAIAQWQTLNGLKTDGIIGPKTWAHMAPLLSPQLPVTSGDNNLKHNIVRIANEEWKYWGYGKKIETDLAMLPKLRDYWLTGVGQDRKKSQLASSEYQRAHPWSAAFISWVMKKSGATDFKRSAAHSTYISAAKHNRLTKNNNPFKAYRITEVKPAPGDLVCKRRPPPPNNACKDGANYDNIRRGYCTHCDIVTEIMPGYIKIIGGNVENSVTQKKLVTDNKGYIKKPGYFAIIKVDDNAVAVSPASGKQGNLNNITQVKTPFKKTLENGFWKVAVLLAIKTGNRDPNKLTNIVFHAKHPELNGRSIRPSEKDLAREWRKIKDQITIPTLRTALST